MKKMFFFLIAQVAYFAHAQTTYGNFKLIDQEIVYQKIFSEDSVSVALLEAYYKTLPYVSNLTTGTAGVQFDANEITVDFKKFQYTPVNTPPIIQTGKYSGKVSVEIKDGKYRVTFQAIQVTGNIGYKVISEKDNLTHYAAKNNGTLLAQDWCRPNMLGLLDKAFTDKLQFVSEKKRADKEDW